MSQFVVRSSGLSDHMTIWIVKPQDEWRARIECDGLTAEARVYERHSGSALRLDAFFGDLAANWRGWDGAKEWESLGLQLVARHTGSGTSPSMPSCARATRPLTGGRFGLRSISTWAG